MEANTVAEHVTNMHKAENQGELADAAAKMIAASHDNVIKAVGKLAGEIRRVEDKLGGEIRRVEDKLGGEIQRVEGKLETRHLWVIGMMIGLTGLMLAVLRILSQTS